MGMTDFDDERNALMKVLQQIKLILDDVPNPIEEEQKIRYIQLRKLVIIWSVEYKRKLEADKGI